MDVSRYVFDEGDNVTGWGEIVQDDGGIWFDPPHGVAMPVDSPPPPRHSPLAVRLIGADARIVAAADADGFGAGWASITGIWRGAAIEVLAQSSVRETPSRRRSGSIWTTPPCPPPPGGWPTRWAGADDDFEALEESENVVNTVTFRPAPDITVLVVAVSDVAAAESELRPRYGASLCIVRSRWTKHQLQEIQQTFHDHAGDWTLSSCGPTVDERAQSTMHVTLLRVPPDMAAWVQGLPDGILRINAALTRA